MINSSKPSAVLSLQVLYIAQLVGILLFSAIIYFTSMQSAPSIDDAEMKKNLFLFVLAIAAICLTAASKLMQKDIKKIATLNSLDQKFDHYRRGAIRTYALFQAPALFAVIGYFLIHESRLFIIIAIIVIRYIFEFPSAKKIAEKIGESEESVLGL